jgi:two-component system KDP operon response regulator KdpE
MSDLPKRVTSILIVENDRQIRRSLRTMLMNEGYHVIDATNTIEGLRQVGMLHPDLILLDLDMPNMDGLEFAGQLRKWALTPIIALSKASVDKEQVLNVGIDDYLTKPFKPDELLARIRADGRSKHNGEFTVVCGGRLRVDMTSRKVYVNEVETHLSPLEYKMLFVMLQCAGKVVSCDRLLREVWGPAYGRQKHYLRVYMAYLRQKIEIDPGHPQYLITEPGVGYRLKVD